MSILKNMVIAIGLVIGVILIFFALSLLSLKRDVGRYKTYWDSQSKLKPSQDDIWYIALGDSAAQGLGASQPEKGYVGLVAQAIKKREGKDVHILNLSVSGAKIQDVIDVQVPRLYEQNLSSKTVITLAIGANDMGSYDAERYRKQMDKLLASLPAQSVVADLPYFGGGRKRNLEPSVQTANKDLRDLIKKRGLRLAPLYDTTKDRDSLRVYATDYFHPSDYGYRNWADAFLRGLGN